MKTLHLCGARNPDGVRLALRVQEEEERWERLVLLDDDPSRQGSSILGIQVAGPFELLAGAEPGTSEVVNLVARTTRGRRTAMNRIASFGVPFASLVHPDVDLLGVELGEGVTVYGGAGLGAGSSLGNGSIVFPGGLVGHGARVAAGCVVGPNAVLNARVELGEGVYVGTNGTVLPDLGVGAWATVAAGSVVLQDVPPGVTAMGVPAELLTTTHAERNEHVAPRNEVQEAVHDLWCEALGLEELGVVEDFFEAGGTSLIMVEIAGLLETTFGATLTLPELFRARTVAATAELLTDRIFESADEDELRRALEEMAS